MGTHGRSRSAASGVVRTVGSPPSADTRHNPVVGSLVANTMLLSSPQLAPSGAPVSGPSVIAAPPVIDTFLSSAFAKNPIHRLSGEENTPSPPPESLSVPS